MDDSQLFDKLLHELTSVEHLSKEARQEYLESTLTEKYIKKLSPKAKQRLKDYNYSAETTTPGELRAMIQKIILKGVVTHENLLQKYRNRNSATRFKKLHEQKILMTRPRTILY